MIKGILTILKQVKDTEKVKELTKYQILDIKELLDELRNIETAEERLLLLEKRSPSLYMYVLEQRGM